MRANHDAKSQVERRRYKLKKLSRLFGTFIPALLLAFVLIATTGGNLQAQPIFTVASGCKESAVLTTEQALNPGTGGFTQDRTLIPGEDVQVVLGAWVLLDGFVVDPTATQNPTPNCSASPDGHNTHVLRVVVKPVSGDPVAAGVRTVSFWFDNDVDGHITIGKDTQIGVMLPGSCLTSPDGCVLSFGNAPIFELPDAGTLGPPLAGGALLFVADIVNPQLGATLQVRLEAFAGDLVNLSGGVPTTQFSSDFAPQYKKQASNTRLVVQGVRGGESGVLSPGVNNASGSPETGFGPVNVFGIRTRDDRGGVAGTLERDARPSDREYFVGMVTLCEAAQPVTENVTILPPIAGAAPTIAGGLGALPCIGLGTPDTFITNIVRIRVGVSGPGAQWVQAVHIYADDGAADAAGNPSGWAAPVAGTAASLFEAGELILSCIPVNGLCAVGSLEQTLTTTGGLLLQLAPGAPGAFFPSLLYFTADIDDRATSSEVRFQAVVDVADVPTIGPTSRLLRTAPADFRFKISGPVVVDTDGDGIPDAQDQCPTIAGPPPTGCPVVRPLTITPSSGSTTRRSARVTATISNPTGAALTATSITATGCEVRRVRVVGVPGVRRLPVTVPAGGSVQVRVSLRCPRGGASWTLSVLQAGGTGTSATLRAFDELAVAKRSDGFTFAALGSNVEAMRLEVFDIAGRKLYDSDFVAGNALSWNMLTDNGTRVANGVYLYVVTIRNANGEIVRSEIRKLAILR